MIFRKSIVSILKTTLASTVMAGGLFSVSVQAAGDPAAERQAMMKHVGDSTKAAAGMIKGETPFDLLAAKLAIGTMNSVALGFATMFPEGSETGAKTEAGPKIWSDRAGFDAAINKFIADTSADFTDESGFKTAFGAATANCKACHTEYRK